MKKAFRMFGSAAATLSLVLLLAGNSALAACPVHDKCPCDHGKARINKEKQKELFEQKRQEIQDRLNLTEEQKAKSKALHEEMRAKMKPVKDKIQAKKQEIKALKESGATKDQIKAKMDEMKPLFNEAKQIREENMTKFEAILTDSQKAELKKIKEEFKQKKEARKQHGKEMRSKMKKPCKIEQK